MAEHLDSRNPPPFGGGAGGGAAGVTSDIAADGGVLRQLGARLAEDGEVAGSGRHEATPLAAVHGVVTLGQLLDLLVGTTAVLLIGEHFTRHGGCGVNGIEHVGEVGILTGVHHEGAVGLDGGLDAGKGLHTLISLHERELRVSWHRLAAGVFLLVEFHLRPAHELRSANGIEVDELAHGRGDGPAHLSAKLPHQPVLVMLVKGEG